MVHLLKNATDAGGSPPHRTMSRLVSKENESEEFFHDLAIPLDFFGGFLTFLFRGSGSMEPVAHPRGRFGCCTVAVFGRGDLFSLQGRIGA
jgi:hypothetical protein